MTAIDKYSRLTDRAVKIDRRRASPWDEIIRELVAIWLDDYRAVRPNGEIVEVADAGFWCCTIAATRYRTRSAGRRTSTLFRSSVR